MIVQELITLLGFDIEDKKLKEFDSLVDQTKTGLIALGAAVTGATLAVYGLIRTTANGADEVKKLSLQAGVATKDLQELGYAGQLTGTSMEELAVGLRFLSKNLSEAIQNPTGETAKNFRRLGVRVADATGKLRSSSDVLLDLSDRFSKINNPTEKAALAMQFFGRSGGNLIELLNAGPDKINKLTDEFRQFGGVMSDEQIDALGEFNDTLDTLFYLVGSIKKSIALELAPVLKDFVSEVKTWFLENRKIIKQNLVMFFRALTFALILFYGIAMRVTKVIATLTANLWGVETALKAVMVAFGLITGVSTIMAIRGLIGWVSSLGTAFMITWLKAMALPLAIAALATIAFLWIEDIIAYFQGVPNTFTGALVKGFKMAMVEMWNWFKEIGGIALQFFTNLADAIIESVFKGPFEALFNFVKKSFELFKQLPGVKAFLDISNNGLTPTDGLSFRRNPTSAPLTGMASVGGNSVNVEAPINVVVPPGTDPGMVGERVQAGVGDGLQKTLRQAQRSIAPSGSY